MPLKNPPEVKKKMSLADYREHCLMVKAGPMVEMIDRIEILSESLKCVLAGLNDETHDQVQKNLEMYGFEAPLK